MKDKINTWYARLLCGYNPLGDFADIACKGTEVEYVLDEAECARGTVQMRCWCCTFWRGVVVGALLTSALVGAWYVCTM